MKERKRPLDAIATGLGRAIKFRRNELALTQAEFADKCGLHRTYLSNVERGERSITITTVASIAKALGFTTSALIGMAEEFLDVE